MRELNQKPLTRFSLSVFMTLSEAATPLRVYNLCPLAVSLAAVRRDTDGTSAKRVTRLIAHFFGIAARLMRQVLVDYARKRSSPKRGADARLVFLDEANNRL
jgi:hypothetical protein